HALDASGIAEALDRGSDRALFLEIGEWRSDPPAREHDEAPDENGNPCEKPGPRSHARAPAVTRRGQAAMNYRAEARNVKERTLKFSQLPPKSEASPGISAPWRPKGSAAAADRQRQRMPLRAAGPPRASSGRRRSCPPLRDGPREMDCRSTAGR